LLNNYFEKILKLANLKYGENMEIKNDFWKWEFALHRYKNNYVA
jgi:hypothetical protein